MRMRIYVAAAGFVAPGLESFADLSTHFGGARWQDRPGWEPVSQRMSPRQARRLSHSVRLAVMAAEQIGDFLPKNAAWVFASSCGEGWALNEILTALAQPEILVQPLRFQNSVHNAAQGQWSIVAGARGPGTSVAAYDNSPGAGLLKAAMQVVIEQIPVGLVVFDAPLPPPLHEKRPIALPMAAALALAPQSGEETLCSLEVSVTSGVAPIDTEHAAAAPELYESGNPVRFLLPLLARIGSPDEASAGLGLPEGNRLEIRVSHVA